MAEHEGGSVLGRFGEVRWLRPASGWYTDTMIGTEETAAAARCRYCGECSLC